MQFALLFNIGKHLGKSENATYFLLQIFGISKKNVIVDFTSRHQFSGSQLGSKSTISIRFVCLDYRAQKSFNYLLT